MITFICLTNSKDDYIQAMTQTCIESILQSDFPNENKLDAARIVLVESQPKIVDYKHVDVVIPFDFKKYGKFNYNYALNLGISYCQANFNDNDWFCFVNNDVIFDKKWLTAMNAAANYDTTFESFCCNPNRRPENVLKAGYATWVNIEGWCILCKADVIDKIGLFDELFDFYFQDDDYGEQLRLHGIKHVKVMNSMALHIGSQTVPELSDVKLLLDGKDKFVAKYGEQRYLEREIEKRQL